MLRLRRSVPSLCLIVFSLFLALSLVACDDDDDDGGGGGPAPLVDLSGDWRGTWQSTLAGAAGNITATILQDERALTGTTIFTQSPCFQSGTITGSVDAFEFEARLGFGGTARVDLAGDIAADEQSISGTYSVRGGGQCQGDRGTFELKR